MDEKAIRTIIYDKKNRGEVLTQEEHNIALQYFQEYEIKMMVWPAMNHSGCFRAASTQKTLPGIAIE